MTDVDTSVLLAILTPDHADFTRAAALCDRWPLGLRAGDALHIVIAERRDMALCTLDQVALVGVVSRYHSGSEPAVELALSMLEVNKAADLLNAEGTIDEEGVSDMAGPADSSVATCWSTVPTSR